MPVFHVYLHVYKQALKLDHLNQHQNDYCAPLVVTLVTIAKFPYLFVSYSLPNKTASSTITISMRCITMPHSGY